MKSHQPAKWERYVITGPDLPTLIPRMIGLNSQVSGIRVCLLPHVFTQPQQATMKFLIFIVTSLSLTFSIGAQAADSMSSSGATAANGKWTLELETGPVWFSRNNVRIPNDTGTRFDMLDLTGEGPTAYARLSATYDFNERHALRLTLAPLSVAGNGLLNTTVRFQDTEVAADTPTRGSYKFNTYRLTYRWMFHRSDSWDLGLGTALLVRDAKIALRQGNLQASDDDLGLVPLLHLYGAYRLSERRSLIVDAQGAAAPQGRTVDLSLKLQHDLPSGWHLFGGYRTLEGGADNDSLYTFAWLHFATIGAGFRF